MNKTAHDQKAGARLSFTFSFAAGEKVTAMVRLKASACTELQTQQGAHRPASVAYRQNVSVAALVLRWRNKQQEMWAVLTRNEFRFVFRIS